jgi:hypothetical protein
VTINDSAPLTTTAVYVGSISILQTYNFNGATLSGSTITVGSTTITLPSGLPQLNFEGSGSTSSVTIDDSAPLTTTAVYVGTIKTLQTYNFNGATLSYSPSTNIATITAGSTTITLPSGLPQLNFCGSGSASSLTIADPVPTAAIGAIAVASTSSLTIGDLPGATLNSTGNMITIPGSSDSPITFVNTGTAALTSLTLDGASTGNQNFTIYSNETVTILHINANSSGNNALSVPQYQSIQSGVIYYGSQDQPIYFSGFNSIYIS